MCSVSLPHGAVGWSPVCDCGISWSYSLFYEMFFMTLTNIQDRYKISGHIVCKELQFSL